MSSATTLIAVNQTAASQPGQTQTQTQTPSPSSAPPTQALNGSSTGHVNVTSALLAKVHKARDRIWKKSLSVVVFIISIVALWATVSSAIDARKATKIAEWTSKKDYLEFCLEHDWNGECDHIRNSTLDSPPGNPVKTWRRGEIYHQHESSPSVGPDLGPNLWGQLLCSSLLFGLLLSHRHFQRKLHRIINSGGSFHQERSGNVADEIHTQFVDHFSAIQPIRDVARLERSEDVNNLGSVTKSADHLATHEIDIASSGSIPKSKVEEAVDDEDFPAWAAEFELPDYYTTRKKSWEDDWWSSVQNRDDAETFRHKFHLDVHKHNIVTEGRRQKLLQKSQCDQGHSESLWGVEYVLDDHFDIPSVKYWNEIHETPIDFRWKNIKSRNRSSYASPAHNIDKHTVWYLEYHYEPHADCLIHYPETDTDESDAENESDNAYAEDYKDQGHDHCFLDSVRDDKDDDHFSIQDDWEEF